MNNRAMNRFTTEEMSDMLDWLATHVKEMKVAVDGSTDWLYIDEGPDKFYALVEASMDDDLNPFEDDDNEDYVTEYDDEDQ